MTCQFQTNSKTTIVFICSDERNSTIKSSQIVNIDCELLQDTDKHWAHELRFEPQPGHFLFKNPAISFAGFFIFFHPFKKILIPLLLAKPCS